MKKAFFLLIAVYGTIGSIAQSNPNKDYSDKTPTVNSNNIFRSTENHYRIKIPQKWTIGKGNSLGAEFNAKSKLGDASLNIIVANLGKAPKFSAHDVPVETIMKAIKSNNPSASLIESEKQFLSNEKAMYIKYKINYKTVDADVDIISVQYSVIKDARIFTITLQAQELTYPSYKDVFRETIQSFTFEHY